jgi:hypothetical protein
MRRFSANPVVPVTFLALSLLCAPVARADNLQTEKAIALFQDGRRLVAEARYGEACERFQQSLSLADGIGTRFNLADCWEHLGRTASAQSLFTEVSASATRAGQLDRAKVARERAAALEPRVARLSIEVEEPAQGLTVRRNGGAVPESQWGKALPVDPGSYSVEAAARGFAGFTRTVQVPATASVVMVTIPKLAATTPGEPERDETTNLEPEPSQLAARPTEPPPPRSVHRLGAAGLTLTLLGVGGVAVGTGFLFKYQSANEDAEAICPKSTLCPRAEINRHDDLVREAKQARVGTFVGYGVGGIALTAALISYLVPSSDVAPERGDLVIRPIISANENAIFAEGRF